MDNVYCGGLSAVECTHISHAWHWTIYLSQVGSSLNGYHDYCLIYILATSVDVEHIFSWGRLILSHVCSHLSAQSTCALICLGSWSLLGLIKHSDVVVVTVLPKVEEEEECELEIGRGSIPL